MSDGFWQGQFATTAKIVQNYLCVYSLEGWGRKFISFNGLNVAALWTGQSQCGIAITKPPFLLVYRVKAFI